MMQEIVPIVSAGRLKIEFAQASDPGRDPNKQVNEDSCGYAETKFGHLCVLCDGMGGHYGGKEASRAAITTIFEVIEQTPLGVSPKAALQAAIEEAGRRVYRLGGPPENRTRPGSTVVAMMLHDRGVDIAHVGDSRAYVIRANQIYPLTRDHSMVQGMIDAGMLTEEQAIGHPDANKITRALGMKPEVEVELRPEPMELFPGDILLQASDGLTDLALSADILGATRQALASGDAAYACDMLVKMANERGGHDNITVQMVRIVEVGLKVSTTIPQAPSAGTQAALGPAPETLSMTSPESVRKLEAAAPAGQKAPSESGAPMPSPLAGSPMQWAPVMPTAPDGPAPQDPPPNNVVPGTALAAMGTQIISAGPGDNPLTASAETAAPNSHEPTRIMGSPGPTVSELQPATPWSSGMYSGPPVPPAAIGVPPAPAQAPSQPHPPGGLAAYKIDPHGPNALPLPPASARSLGFGPPAPTQVPGHAYTAGAAPLTPTPVSQSTSGALPAKGGLIAVVIGLSAAVAVLLLILLWALFLR